jgi:pipecolate-incorporating enzyme
MTSSDLRDEVTLAVASVGQRQLWMHDRLYAHDGSYNVPLGIRLIGPLDVRALRAALEAVVERHEPLRTTFTFEDGELYQAVASHQSVACPLVVVDPPAAGGWDQVQRALEADGTMPFDLAVGPLLRTTLYELDDRTHALTVIVHHAVFDGWSVGVFLDELGACYEAAASGRQPTLPPLPVQFADFAEWQREQLDTPEVRPGLAYWTRQVADATLRLELPFDRPPHSLQARQGRMVAAQAPPELRQALQAVCRGENVTLFVVLLAAFTATLHRYTKQTDLLIGTPMAGRSRQELEPLIGMLINTVLIRSSVAEGDTFRDLLRRMRQQVVDAHTHQDIPYDRVLELIPREVGAHQIGIA